MRSKHSGGKWDVKPYKDKRTIGQKWMRLLGGYGQRGKQIDREVKKATK